MFNLKKIILATSILALSTSSVLADKNFNLHQVRDGGDPIAQMLDPTVMVTNEGVSAGGSGTVIGQVGEYDIVLTAAHVVNGITNGYIVYVSDDGGESTVRGIVVNSNEVFDLAIVLVPSSLLDSSTALVADTDTQLHPFDQVWTVGAGALLPPFPTEGLFGVGNVSDLYGSNHPYDISGLASIGGNSGGGFYHLSPNGDYELVGVLQAGPSDTVSLTAPIDTVWTVIEEAGLQDYVNVNGT